MVDRKVLQEKLGTGQLAVPIGDDCQPQISGCRAQPEIR